MGEIAGLVYLTISITGTILWIVLSQPPPRRLLFVVVTSVLVGFLWPLLMILALILGIRSAARRSAEME
jgi:hypothetical protein